MSRYRSTRNANEPATQKIAVPGIALGFGASGAVGGVQGVAARLPRRAHSLPCCVAGGSSSLHFLQRNPNLHSVSISQNTSAGRLRIAADFRACHRNPYGPKTMADPLFNCLCDGSIGYPGQRIVVQSSTSNVKPYQPLLVRSAVMWATWCFPCQA